MTLAGIWCGCCGADLSDMPRYGGEIRLADGIGTAMSYDGPTLTLGKNATGMRILSGDFVHECGQSVGKYDAQVDIGQWIEE